MSVQIVKQTKEEKVEMYSKLKKKDLISMLINVNDQIEVMLPKVQKLEIYEQTKHIKGINNDFCYFGGRVVEAYWITKSMLSDFFGLFKKNRKNKKKINIHK
jgi:hypothetical protein